MAGYATTKNPSKAYKLNEDDATEEEAGRGTEELDGMQLQIDLDSQQFTTSSRAGMLKIKCSNSTRLIGRSILPMLVS